MASKYCCFINPTKGYKERELTDISPAGFPYGFPIFNPPTRIGDFEVINPIDRGFYGATYEVKDSLLQFKVLKVIPKAIYQLFNKNFDMECIAHARLANNSSHIVGINNKFSANVEFPNVATIECHVAVLDYVKGITLKKLIESDEQIGASKIGQISIDLFTILNDLANNKLNHNDLHPGNLIVKELDVESKRFDQIHKYVKVIAIDLGSLDGESKSADGTRTGDIHWVAQYVRKLSQKLLDNKENLNTNEYRLAFLLDEVARRLFAKAENLRVKFIDIIDEIKTSFRRTYSWNQELSLNTFSDLYNAQSMSASHIPLLFVDPENKWVKDISNRGALIITGMRGCGKTMLLRALEFHARAVSSGSEKIEQTKERLSSEKFVGLYVSSSRLLDKLGKPEAQPLFEPYSRLFFAYTIQALKALNHLKTVDSDIVNPNYYQEIIKVIENLLSDKSVFKDVNSEESLENRLIDILVSLGREESKYKIELSPVQAFPMLADALRRSSSMWLNHYVFFLLDDVSTRYFDDSNIVELLSSLIFQNEMCAFKITSEAQTIQLMLRTPGKIGNAKIGRDLESYDLGQEVYNLIKDNFRNGKKFIEQILIKRTEHFPTHPSPTLKPSELLGDCTLDEIAENIARHKEQKGTKNRIYHGISALAGVCVGDIGEVVTLYEQILGKWKGAYPISDEEQSACFRDLSSIRLFQLNRIKSNLNLKDYALSFAEAAHDLLKKSAVERPSEDYNLRQYYSIYVDITKGQSGDKDVLFNKLIELVDAGIFVFLGGSSSPRTTNRYTNPLTQFVLIYRKLYGITSLIGLVHGDRFEISGEQLSEWLNNPKKGKEILKKGLGTGEYKPRESEDIKLPTKPKRKNEKVIQKAIFDDSKALRQKQRKTKPSNYILEKLPRVTKVDQKFLKSNQIDQAVIGLGFEERTEASASKIIKLQPKKIQFIEYEELGKKTEIIKQAKDAKIPFSVVSYDDAKKLSLENGNVLIDVSGLSKNLIFHSVKDAYTKNRKLLICHTKPKAILPDDRIVESLLGKKGGRDLDFEFLQNLTQELSKGEQGPYSVIKLMESNTDALKNRVLVTFSSPKYERVFKVLDEREFDFLELILPKSDVSKNRLAKLATEVIKRRFNYSNVSEFDNDDLDGFLKHLAQIYFDLHILNGYNLEIALTGSKRHTVAAAILSSSFQVSRCWYVRPNKWDSSNFSKGVGKTEFFEIASMD